MMVNISKKLFNFLYDVVFDENCAGSPYGLVVKLMNIKYEKYIDYDFNNEEYLKGLKKLKYNLVDCKGCIYTEDCKILAYQSQKGGNAECIVCKLKKEESGETSE